MQNQAAFSHTRWIFKECPPSDTQHPTSYQVSIKSKPVQLSLSCLQGFESLGWNNTKGQWLLFRTMAINPKPQMKASTSSQLCHHVAIVIKVHTHASIYIYIYVYMYIYTYVCIYIYTYIYTYIYIFFIHIYIFFLGLINNSAGWLCKSKHFAVFGHKCFVIEI